MKNIENLLHRYYEGDLAPEELAELNRLTHRDQVLQAASRQAQIIRRRRRSAIVGVVAVLAVVGVVYFAQPTGDNNLSESPMVAKAEVPTMNEAVTNTQATPIQTVPPQAATTAVSNDSHHEMEDMHSEPKLVQAMQVEHPVNIEVVVEQQESSVVSEPVVACNTQCSPDSVINDIWKFLRT